MRRAVVALIVTVAVVVLLQSFHTHVPALRAGGRPASVAPSSTGTTSASTGSRKSGGSTPRRTGTTATRSALGDAIQFRYGVVQVKATVRGSQLVGVQMVTLNPDGGRSQSIDAQAEPLLHQEALQAHSANIDVVSGATYTSQAYAQSLQSAIDRARGA
jgi:uncharacterized protein with FMN-binding domain